MYDRIVVPVDESDGEGGLVLGRALARRLGATLTLLHVHHLREAPTDLEGMTQYRYQHVVEAWDGMDSEEESHEVEWLARKAAEQTAAEPGLVVTSRVIHAPLGRALPTGGERVMVVARRLALIRATTGPASILLIDIATGEVLFEWNSADHVPFSESREPLPESANTPWDWFHVNAAHLDTDDNLLIDARHTWATYKVNRAGGDIIWTLGGDNSSFRLRAAPGQRLNRDGEIFAWQHDPEALGNGLYTWFDNESSGAGRDPLGYSRVVTVRVDEERRVATLVASIKQPDRLSAESQGNAQTTIGRRVFVGWGSLPYISQFDRAGRLLFHARFPEGVNTYRAYMLRWNPKHARPHS